MTRTRTKICGITRPEDALVAAQLGVDAIGLVFYAKSPRNVSIRQAAEILQSLPAFVTSVGLFMNPQLGQVERVLSELRLDCLQFHGTESPEFVGQFGVPYIKALGMAEPDDLRGRLERYPDSSGFLLDSHAHNEQGGTGVTFDWHVIPTALRAKVIVAGGISADNVADCIQQINPYAIDVSSGVESAPGIKDKDKMTKMFSAIRQAND